MIAIQPFVDDRRVPTAWPALSSYCDLMAKDLACADPIALSIRTVRGQRVLLDSDLAAFYGVTTTALNQAVKRNTARFAVDFAFRLTAEVSVNLK